MFIEGEIMKTSLLILCTILGLAGCATSHEHCANQPPCVSMYSFNNDPLDPDAAIREIPVDPQFPNSTLPWCAPVNPSSPPLQQRTYPPVIESSEISL